MKNSQAVVAAAEQRPAEIRLERLDLMADRRRGHVELFGRLGEAQVARGGLEGAQRVERRKTSGHAVYTLEFLI